MKSFYSPLFFLPTFEIEKKKLKIARYKTDVEMTVVTEEFNSSQI